MIRLCSLALIVCLLFASPGFSQDINRAQLQQLTKLQPVHASYFLPPQGQPATSPQPSAPQTSSGTSHKKRNIIIAVVVGAVVAGVVVAASNSSGSGY